MRDILLTALQQARLAMAGYEGARTVEHFAANQGARYAWIQVGHVSAGVLVFRDHLHIAVTGTNDLYDWVQNLDATHATRKGYTLHRGFADATEMLWTELHRSGVANDLSGRKLVLGGHSAGGAIAQALALRDGFQPNYLITLGAPRIFSPTSAAIYARNPWQTHRFVMPGDVAPRFPFRNYRLLYRGADYAHTTPEILLDDDGTVTPTHDFSLSKQLWRAACRAASYASVVTAYLGYGKSRVWQNHSITRYTAALRLACHKE